MSGTFTRVRNGMLAAAVMGALGFGAGQALAGPVQANEQQQCNPRGCNARCEAMFGPFASGFCDPEFGCVCAV